MKPPRLLTDVCFVLSWSKQPTETGGVFFVSSTTTERTGGGGKISVKQSREQKSFIGNRQKKRGLSPINTQLWGKPREKEKCPKARIKVFLFERGGKAINKSIATKNLRFKSLQ